MSLRSRGRRQQPDECQNVMNTMKKKKMQALGAFTGNRHCANVLGLCAMASRFEGKRT